MPSPALTDGPQKHTCGFKGDDEIDIIDCRLAHFIHNVRIMQLNLPLYEDVNEFYPGCVLKTSHFSNLATQLKEQSGCYNS